MAEKRVVHTSTDWPWVSGKNPPEGDPISRRVLIKHPKYPDMVAFGRYLWLPGGGVWKMESSPSDWEIEWWAEIPAPPK